MEKLNRVLNELSTVTTSVELCHTKFDKTNEILTAQKSLINECLTKIENLETKNKVLQTENNTLKNRINELEQYSRANCLEIHGIPEVKGENIFSIVQLVSNAIGFRMENNLIDAVHRLGQPVNRQDQPRGIILKFVRRIDKEEFLRCKKIKRNLKVSNIYRELPAQNNLIYVNESLTQQNRYLFAKAREFKRDNDIKYLWCRSGKILMRAKDESRAYIIKSTDDFKDVH
ncbi:hypothetical protein RI129_008177 [Pyrocoelia pectoralis]|uniref:FP protein C-terminal domain-containing protein n=1 Tax=Pyrocoelia pectoralis TaxID=417401 RepID=A0AAN7V4U2_9COLE